MALSADEEEKVRKLVQKEDLQKEIESINKAAETAIQAKKDEITALENKRISDVRKKKDQIGEL